MPTFSLQGRDFVLRDLRRSDGGQYLVFFNALGEESIRCRFGYLLAKLTESAASQRTTGNPEQEQALAVFDDSESRILAIGRCYFSAASEDSEIALVVTETVRGPGLGRFLLRQLIQISPATKKARQYKRLSPREMLQSSTFCSR